MKMSGAAQRLIIYIGESDEWEGEPLYVALVKKFREMGIAGVTVVRGIMGYGANNRIHKAKLLTLSEDMPIRIEVVRYSQDPRKGAHFGE